MSSRSAAPPQSFLGAAGLLVLIVAGFVVSVSICGLDVFPRDVVAIAWVIAAAACAVVILSTFHEARRTGSGFFASLGRSFATLGRFLFWFLVP